MKTQLEKLAKETLNTALLIMVNNVKVYGSTEDCWNQSKKQIMEEVGTTEKGALMFMRAVMSLVNGELHPAFKN